ncbi:hypothetical protein AMECASPLE_004935 [Ameca splendens]|uniref:Uncharacterized protein n=1 Tax=Ameca splendens TaxID=208324 RepID=A0ABV0ZW28_9TELE
MTVKDLQLDSYTGLLHTAEHRVNYRFGISLQTTHHHINTDTQGPVSCCRLDTCSHLNIVDICSVRFSLKHKRTLHCRASSSPSLTWRIYNAALDRGSALRSTFTCQEIDWVGRCDPLPSPIFLCGHKK